MLARFCPVGMMQFAAAMKMTLYAGLVAAVAPWRRPPRGISGLAAAWEAAACREQRGGGRAGASPTSGPPPAGQLEESRARSLSLVASSPRIRGGLSGSSGSDMPK